MDFGDFFEKLAKVLDGIEPILEVAAAVAFPGSTAIVAAVKYGVGMISKAEKAYGNGTGPIKRDYVVGAATDFLSGFKAASTGGQLDTVERFAPFMGTVIDGIIAGTKAIGVRWDETALAAETGNNAVVPG